MTTDPNTDIDQKDLSRFWAKVNKTDSCWLWTGATDQHGYGQFWSKGRRYAVHRLSYRLAHGDIPKGLVLDHLCHGWDANCKAEGNWCRHRACVNPTHLEAVTHRENLLRGHGVSGEAARRTYCPQGHPYDKANTYFEGGARRCRACREARKAAARTVPPSEERTHCPQGHPYNEENTYRRPNGDRSCRTCRREQARQSRQSQPARRKAQVPPPTDRTPVLLSEAERLMLRHALDLADANISARPDEYTAADEAALASLRRLADEAQQPTTERPRCQHCGLPHDLTPGSLPWAACEITRQRIARAELLHAEGDHSLCCRADCDVLQQRADEAQQQSAAVQPAEPGTDCAHCGNPIRRITGTLTAWWVHCSGGQSACHPERTAVSPRATPRRVKHAGPDTEFCVLCLSGEHERVTDAAPQQEPPVHGESVAHLAGYQPDGHDTRDGEQAGGQTPCGPAPDQCDAEAGDPCANHEREQAHDEGEHCFCGPECEGVPTGRHYEVHDETRPVCSCGRFWPCDLAIQPAVDARQDGAQQDTDSPRTVCVCGHTRGEHLTVSGRLLCDTCDPDSTDNLVCRGFDAL